MTAKTKSSDVSALTLQALNKLKQDLPARIETLAASLKDARARLAQVDAELKKREDEEVRASRIAEALALADALARGDKPAYDILVAKIRARSVASPSGGQPQVGAPPATGGVAPPAASA